MRQRRFSLQPFPTVAPLPRLQIQGSISRSSGNLTVHYEVLGEVDDIAIPVTGVIPLRKNGLWLETCLELFLALRDSPGYWEFNLSPAGHWNVYRFTSYREGMQEERAYSELPFSVEIQPKALLLALHLSLDPIAPPGKNLDVGICSVILDQHWERSYWALNHRGSRPDFHHRDSFSVRM